MKEHIYFAALFPLVFIALAFAMYACVSFLLWIFNDPFHWVNIEPVPYQENNVWKEQRDACVAKGGIPIKSNWDGQLKECKL